MSENRRAVPELSVDTQTIERLLWEIPVGETVSYARLSEAIGRDVQHAARHILTSACDRVLREKQMVFAPVVGVGMKRLDDVGIVSTGSSTIQRIFNLSRRGLRRLAAVANFDALPNEQKVKHNLTMGQLGMLAHATKGATVKKLEQRAGNSTAPLPTAKFLEAMKETL
jgi:hypothetical protein